MVYRDDYIVTLHMHLLHVLSDSWANNTHIRHIFFADQFSIRQAGRCDPDMSCFHEPINTLKHNNFIEIFLWA